MSNKTDLLVYLKKMFLNAKALDLKTLINEDYKLLIEALKFYDKRISKRYDDETNYLVRCSLIFKNHLKDLDIPSQIKFLQKYDVEHTMLSEVLTTLGSVRGNRNNQLHYKLFLDFDLYFNNKDLKLDEIQNSLQNKKLFETNHFILKENDMRMRLIEKKNKLLEDVNI